MATVQGKGLLKSLDGRETLWSMRQNIMFGLFDLGRLMTEDPKRFQAYQNEAARICNKIYQDIKMVVEGQGLNEEQVVMIVDGEWSDEKQVVASYFGYKKLFTEDSIFGNMLRELMTFMYDNEKRTDFYLARVQRIIDDQYEAHYLPELHR